MPYKMDAIIAQVLAIIKPKKVGRPKKILTDNEILAKKIKASTRARELYRQKKDAGLIDAKSYYIKNKAKMMAYQHAKHPLPRGRPQKYPLTILVNEFANPNEPDNQKIDISGEKDIMMSRQVSTDIDS